MPNFAEKLVTTAALAGTIIGCNNPSTAPVNESASTEQNVAHNFAHEAIDKLAKSGVHFVDAEGNNVNLKTLQDTLLIDKPSTVSFMFAICPIVCPTTASTLRNVTQSGKIPGIKHVVISVDPANDFYGYQDNAKNLPSKLAQKGLTPPNTLVLYPVAGQVNDNKSNLRELLEESANQSLPSKVQGAFETLFHGKEVEQHTPSVMLFDNTGKKITQVTAIGNNIEEAAAGAAEKLTDAYINRPLQKTVTYGRAP